MALSVKQKIQYGTLFLFLLILLTGGAGIYFTSTLKKEAKAVLQDNYESIAYCYSMQQELDSINLNHGNAITKFDRQLVLQEHNITEPGENEATISLRRDFDRLRSGDSSRQNILNIQIEIQRVLYLNMNAIHNKDENAQRTAGNAVTIIICLVAIVFMVSFTFSFNFPSLLISPINELSDGIKEISNKNYKHRIHVDNKDEFGALADAFNNMADRLEYFESSSLNKLMFEKTRAEAVINSLKDASIGIDKNNVILFANQQALQLLGLKPVDIVGKTVEDVSPHNDLFQFLVTNESTAPFKVVVNNRENYFTREIIEVAQGTSNSKVIVLRNITSFKELDVAKTNFIATISHELKTPLASSDLSLKLLEDERTGILSIEQQELVQNLRQDNQRVLKILSELLNMSQVETGRIELNIQEVDPYAIVTNAMGTVATVAKEKNIQIVPALAPDLPMIHADAEKSTWVLNNFLTNAIKYTNEGSSIDIIVKRTNGNVQFSVADYGQGIAPEYIPRLFERYFQVPGSKVKGTGLGLAISKDFIEAQKGKIAVESKIGTGSVFSFMLPVSNG